MPSLKLGAPSSGPPFSAPGALPWASARALHFRCAPSGAAFSGQAFPVGWGSILG